MMALRSRQQTHADMFPSTAVSPHFRGQLNGRQLSVHLSVAFRIIISESGSARTKCSIRHSSFLRRRYHVNVQRGSTLCCVRLCSMACSFFTHLLLYRNIFNIAKRIRFGNRNVVLKSLGSTWRLANESQFRFDILDYRCPVQPVETDHETRSVHTVQRQQETWTRALFPIYPIESIPLLEESTRGTRHLAWS